MKGRFAGRWLERSVGVEQVAAVAEARVERQRHGERRAAAGLAVDARPCRRALRRSPSPGSGRGRGRARSGWCRRGTAGPRCAAARRRDADAGVADAQQRAAAVARRPRRRTRPPAGVYFTALSIRLAATCSSRVRSARHDDVVGARRRRQRRRPSRPRRRDTDRRRASTTSASAHRLAPAAASRRSRPRRCPSAC